MLPTFGREGITILIMPFGKQVTIATTPRCVIPREEMSANSGIKGNSSGKYGKSPVILQRSCDWNADFEKETFDLNIDKESPNLFNSSASQVPLPEDRNTFCCGTGNADWGGADSPRKCPSARKTCTKEMRNIMLHIVANLCKSTSQTHLSQADDD